MENNIAYLGPKGTFTKIAVDAVFNGEEKNSYRTIPACIDAVDEGDVKFAVVPLENTIEGSVNLTLDYLIQKDTLKIVGEVVVPIQQHLMVHPNNEASWENIEKIYSHPHAIAQCHQFLHHDMDVVDAEYMSSTGAAAQYVSENPNRSIGAIANELAAEEYGLKIVRRNIHDFSNNHTRFVVLHKEDFPLTATRMKTRGFKTTLMITLPADHPGALHQVLSAFAWRRINLSKIESRPMKTGLGNYFFLIDIEQKLDDILIPNAIAELEALGCAVSVMGSYPYYKFEGIAVTK